MTSMNHTDHHPHEHQGNSMMMMMYFHGGFNEVILFDFWRISSLGGLLGSMLACFAMSVAYEGLKFLRETMLRRQIQSGLNRYETLTTDNTEEVSTAAAAAGAGDQEQTGSGSQQEIQYATGDQPSRATRSSPRSIRTLDSRICSRVHLMLTLLHLLQMTLAYFLMLIVMTFNSWLCLAVLMGATAGYFLFGWRRTLMLEETDHCH